MQRLAAKNDVTVRVRLRQAALDLFRERGYDRTTAAEIAARVGVTERTFFRHFRDKREVLFDGEAILRDALTGFIADAPPEDGPLTALFRAFRSVVPMLEDNRPFSEPWHEIVSATPPLRERELAKREVLAEALSGALRARGVDEERARLSAQAGMAIFVYATLSWLDDPRPSLADRLDRACQELAALFRETVSDGLGDHR